MSKLEDLQANASLRGILPDALVTVVNVQWFGSEALELTYKDPSGRVANQLLYRHDEPRARTLEWAAGKVEQALRDESDQLLTLPQAAEISGYHPDSLARMVRDGQIHDLRLPNSKGMIRIRRGDLPIKPGRPHTPDADVRELASRLFKRG